MSNQRELIEFFEYKFKNEPNFSAADAISMLEDAYCFLCSKHKLDLFLIIYDLSYKLDRVRGSR